jgi:hypothetical protein
MSRFETIKFFGNNGSVHNIELRNFDRTATDLYVDAPLTNVSVAYKNTDYIADLVLPKIPVRQETGLIWTMGTQNFNIKDLQRGDKSVSKRSGYTVDAEKTYRIINYALSDVVTSGMVNQAVNPMQPEADTTEYLTEQLMLNKEYLVGTALFNTGATGFSGYTEALSTSASRYRWDDYTNSNPLDDAAYCKNKIATNSGATSGIQLVIGEDVMTYLQNHPDILDRIKYTQFGVITEDLIAKAMQIDRLIVGKALYNTANEGQTATLARVWGKYALFMHRPASVGLKTAATAVMLHGGNYVRKWTENALQGATVVEVQEAFQAMLLSARSGYLLSTAVS